MNESRWSAIAVLVLASVAASCDAGSSCTDIACADGLTVVTAPASGIWQAGDYEVEITHDGVTENCSFSLPDDLPTADSITLVDCGKPIHANLYARPDCTDTCTLTNQFEFDFYFNSKPESLSVKMTRDGEVVLDEQPTIEYSDVFPNGPECGALCQQARVNLTVAP